MSTRFVSNAVVALAAGFVVVASQAFSPSTTGWIAFAIAIAIGILTVASVAQADRSRGLAQRAVDGMTAIVSGWTIVASVVFHGTVLLWLSAGEGSRLSRLPSRACGQ
jgi:hypothetical protein